MPHEDIYRKGVKLVSVTQIPTIIHKMFMDPWRLKLCHCNTHVNANKTKLKPAEMAVIEAFGVGHCGYVYADQVRDDAGDLGTEVHDLVDQWLKTGQKTTGSQAARMWADKIIGIYVLHNVKPHIVRPEETLIDEESGLNGSPDHPILWDGDPFLADLKIKNQLDALTGVQGWLYRYLIRRKYNFDFRWMKVIHCKKESKNQDVEDVNIDLDEWEKPTKALVTIWNTLNPKRKVHLFEWKT